MGFMSRTKWKDISTRQIDTEKTDIKAAHRQGLSFYNATWDSDTPDMSF